MLTEPRAGGGIGRRARLRALWANSPWRFESSPAHDEKPAEHGLFASSPSSARDGGDARDNTRDNELLSRPARPDSPGWLLYGGPVALCPSSEPAPREE